MKSYHKLSSTELGAIWMTYHKKTMILRMLEYFIEKAEDPKAKSLMSDLWKKLNPFITEMETILKKEGAVCPVGFTKQDVLIEAERLYDNGFDILFCRILKEISMGMYVLHMTISYREDIILFYKKLTELTQDFYHKFTQLLLNEELLPTPNLVNMPKTIDFITDTNYMKGSNFFGQKRTINTV